MAINTNTENIVKKAIKKELCGDTKKYRVKKLTAVETATKQGIKFANDNGDGVWRTIKGRKIFIKKGQSVEDAVSSSSKFKIKKSATDNIRIEIKSQISDGILDLDLSNEEDMIYEIKQIAKNKKWSISDNEAEGIASEFV